MGTSLSIDAAANGGFPRPVKGEPLRVVAARHDECGARTQVQIPRSVPARAVRRIHCSGCDQDFEAGQVKEVGLRSLAPNLSFPARPSLPARPRLSLPARPSLPALPSFDRLRAIPAALRVRTEGFDPSHRVWRLVSIPLAAVLVVGGLIAIQGGGDAPAPPAGKTPALSQPSAPAANDVAHAERAATPTGRELDQRIERASKDAELVQGSSFHLALPAKWERIEPPSGATFAATAPGGEADATLWIEEDPSLSFDRFVTRSRKQLESFAGSAHELERVAAPTIDDSLVRLAADAPPGQPTYEVLLRASGPYRYYMATTVEAGASPEALDGVALITESFSPEGGV